MSQPRPPLKLKLSTSGSAHPPPPPAPPPDTPSTNATPKLKLKFGPKTTQPTPNAPPPSLTQPTPPAKPGRKPKKDKPPRAATSSGRNKKRDHAAVTHSDDDEEPNSTITVAQRPPIKKLKLNTRTPTTPFIRLKGKGKAPPRALGVGYDSEASDREVDPAIEEEFIFRMLPGEDCEYIRKAVEEKRWGPRNQGGADIRMKFLTRDGRRAMVSVRGKHYAAVLVDLPCVIEGMKSWDRRGWWKTADLCQMLMVLGRVMKEEEAMTYPLPGGRDLDKETWAYAHGLTAPMRWVRERRFRKRVSNRAIELVEEEVERLLREDDDCGGASRYEVLDLERLSKEQSAQAESVDFDAWDADTHTQPADGEMDESADYFDTTADAEDDGLADELELAMREFSADEDGVNPAAAGVDSAPTPDTSALLTGAATPDATIPDNNSSAANTPAATTPGHDSSSSSDDADGSGDDDDDDSDNSNDESNVDDDVLEQQQDLQRQREEIADLQAAIGSQTAELEKLQNPILRTKVWNKIQSLKGDLELKMNAIGEGEDE